MRKIYFLSIVLTLIFINGFAQEVQREDSLRQKYQSEQKVISKSFSNYFYPNRTHIFSLPEKEFVAVIDSLRNTFQKNLNQYKIASGNTNPVFIHSQETDIHYFFDKFILDYPYFHKIATGKKTSLSTQTQKRLDKNLQDLNNPELLSSEDFKEYVRGFLRHRSTIEITKTKYKNIDNQRLFATLAIIPEYITNLSCRDFWNYDYINIHLEDFGVKNLEKVISDFNSSSKDTSYLRKINALYTDGIKERRSHLIKTYKTVDGFSLDIHLFMPDSVNESSKKPAMVYFSGGSWTKGNPEWAFYNCAAYARKGWVGVSVEYRLVDRQGTTPFEAVMDARSAIRWLRMNAGEYGIDPNRIVASGNSAGGHLILTTALADKWNEKTDNLKYSPTPNLLLVNAGVYDFIKDENTRWVSEELKDKNTVKEISPVHLIKDSPPMLLIHGTNDQSVPYSTAKEFEDLMKKTGNDTELITLEGASHYLWFDRRFSKEISAKRNAFLKKHGYE